MLRRVSVTGFKSLNNFEMDISPGLNVLIGTNGSGKTNIIRFFEFVSNLSTHSLAEAISKSGGAGDIFTRESDQEIIFTNTISLALTGNGFSRDTFARNHGDSSGPFVFYHIASEIEFSGLEDVLHFNNQEVRLAVYKKRPRKDVDPSKAYNVRISMSRASGVVIDAGVSTQNAQSRRVLTSVKPYITLIKAAASAGDNFIGSILSRFLPVFMLLDDDVSLGQVYNVLPSKVREPEDIARPPVINHDGSGLAATLYRLKKSALETKSYLVPRNTRGFRFPPDTFERVKANFLLVNDYFSDIDVKSDNYDNRLKVYAKLKASDGNDDVVLPLNVLSDGTIKWLAIVTAIETNKSYFAIEEPENFLHPAMQKEFVEIVRSVYGHDEDRFAIVTTHSETLLNTLKPEEVVTVTMNRGSTSARRFSNVKRIRDEINRTGFGLGYYYVGGSFE